MVVSFPLEYIAWYALPSRIPRQLSYLIVVFLNVCLFPRRDLPGNLADRIGVFSRLLLSNILSLVAVVRLGIPSGGNKVAVIVLSVVFLLASGSNISLDLVCMRKLCPGEG